MTLHCLARITPLYRPSGERPAIHIASANLRSLTGLGGYVWEPAMVSAPNLSLRLFNGDFQAAVEPGNASLPIHIGVLKNTYPWADECSWAGAEVEIWAGEAGEGWPWRQVFRGQVSNYRRQGQVLTLTAEVGFEDKDLLTRKYAGTGGAEGDPDLIGKMKPLVLGWAKNVEPLLINAVDSVYQLSAYGAIEAVTTLYERGSDFGTVLANHATYAALVAATIPPGKWATCLAEGLIRLGAPAFGVITADLKGHAIAGVTPRLSGAMIAALGGIAGIDRERIESATLAAMDAAAPYPINLVVAEQVKFADLARRIALPCNCQSGISLLGNFFVAKVTIDDAAEFTLDAQGKALPQVIDSIEQDVSPPYYRTIMGANRSWRVHTPDEISFTAPLIPKGRYDAATTYREGNHVDLADGSMWLYIFGQATAGNAPPAPPATANTWWSRMNPPYTAAGITYTDGTPIQNLKPAEAAADVTATAQVTVEMASDKTVAADYLGAVSAANLAALVWSPRVVKGGTSIKITDAAQYALSNSYGGTFAVSTTNGASDKGDITISAITANIAGGELAVTVSGVVQPKIAFKVTKAFAAPPAGGSAGNYPKLAQWFSGEFVGINTTTYTMVVTALKKVTLATGQTLYGTAPLDYEVSGTTIATRTMTVKWQYSVAGANSWSDFGAGITGSTASSGKYISGEWIDPVPGSVAVTQSVAPAAGDYDVRLVAICSTTGRTCTLSGAATIEAKV